MMPRSPLRAAIISAVDAPRVADVDRRAEHEQLPDEGVVPINGRLDQPAAEPFGRREQRGHRRLAARDGELVRRDAAFDGRPR
jgi:hypothetical protein